MKRFACLVVVGCSSRESPPPPSPSPPVPVVTRPDAAPKPPPRWTDPLPDDERSNLTPRIAVDAPLTWVRSTSRQFGCMLERAGHADPTYHCAAPKPPAGDPCDDTASYYAGPAFPDALIPTIGFGVQSVTLHWEHGELQAVDYGFGAGIDEKAIAAAFDMPSIASRHPNVMEAHLSCGKKKPCLVVQGFDHVGAGDVECPKK